MKKRPEYFRRLPTPVADQAARETVYIPQNIFLGTAEDMEEIVAAVKKGRSDIVRRGTRRVRVTSQLALSRWAAVEPLRS